MASLGRSSAMIAAGTMASRILGLVRTMMLTLVIGSTIASDAFTIANNLPNTVFNLVSAGLLTAVFVPQIVKATQTHSDGGSAFVSKLFTLSTVGLIIVTAVSIVAAPWLIHLFAGNLRPDAIPMAIAFAYWCMPQLLFYGLFALVGESLNARKVYGPYTWAPVVNNVVSIAGLAVFMLIFGTDQFAVSDWTPDKIALFGGTATLGIIVQFVVLALFWRRANLKIRPDFRWRGVGLGATAKLAGWTFLMVLISTAAGAVQTWVVSGASNEVNPGATAMSNAWLVYMLPYSIIVLSIGTPYFTRIAEHASAGRKSELLADIDSSIRTLGVFIALAAAALAAAAVPATRIFSQSGETAVLAAPVLLANLLNLLPVAILFIVQRTFYVYGDTKTPFWFTLLQAGIIVTSALVALVFVDKPHLALVAALGQTFATIIQTIVAVLLLRRRIGSLNSRHWLLAYGRFAIAGLPAMAAGWGVFLLLGGTSGWTVAPEAFMGKLGGMAGVLIIGATSAVVYVVVLALLRAPELRAAVTTVRRIIGR